MREKIESWLKEMWYGGRQPPAWLRALTPLYSMAFRFRKNRLQAQQPDDLRHRPIVVVGNITVGGSGKTPLVIWLARALQSAGMNPGVASRGYGRKSSGLQRVTETTSPQTVGDEPLMISQRLGVPVVVATDRCRAARALFDLGVDVVIADDGLQHHRLPRALEICVVDGKYRWGNGRLLPAGPLREPIQRLKDCDYLVINDADTETADHFWIPSSNVGKATAVAMHFVPGLLHALDRRETWRLPQFSGCRVNAVAGIGHPERFFHALQRAGLHVIEHPFPDHHAYVPGDFANLEQALPIIMTEKDAVKCRGMMLQNAWYLTVDATLPAAFERDLVERIGKMVAARKTAA